MATNFPISKSKLTAFEDPTQRLKFTFGQINSENKVFADSLEKFLLDFFKNNASKRDTTTTFYFANKLASNLISFISDYNSKSAADNEIFNYKIDNKNIEKYISDLFAKDIARINSLIDGIAFTDKDLNALKKEVLRTISNTIDLSFKEAKKKDDGDSGESAASLSNKIFSKHRGMFTSEKIYLPKIDFDKVNLFLQNGVFKKFSKESNAYASKLVEKTAKRLKKDAKYLSDSEIFSLKMKEIRQRINESKEVKKIKEIREKFLNETIPSFRETHHRLNRLEFRLDKLSKIDLKRALRSFGQKIALKIKLTMAFFFPISEILFVMKAASKLISFSINTINFVYRSFKKIVGSIANIGKTVFSILGKSLNIVYKSIKYVVTSSVIKAFFSTYVGAYVLGFAIGFLYNKFKKMFSAAKELYDKIRLKILKIYKDHEEEIEAISARISNFVAAAGQTAFVLGYTAYDLFDRLLEGEDFDEALFNSLNDIRSGTTGRSLGIGSMIDETISYIDKTFTAKNIQMLIDAGKASIGGGFANIVGSTLGSIVGGAVGTAILGPFGTVPFAMLGSFIGETAAKYVYRNGKKLESSESRYSEYLRNTFGRTTEFSSVEDFMSVEKRANTEFGVLMDLVRKRRDSEALGKTFSISSEDEARLRDLNIPMDMVYNDSNYAVLNKILSISNADLVDEANSALGLIDKLTNTFSEIGQGIYNSTDHANFVSQQGGDMARTTSIPLSDGTSKIEFFNQSITDRNVLAFRAYRAIAIGNLIARMYDSTITPEQFLKYYKELDTLNLDGKGAITIDRNLIRDDDQYHMLRAIGINNQQYEPKFLKYINLAFTAIAAGHSNAAKDRNDFLIKSLTGSFGVSEKREAEQNDIFTQKLLNVSKSINIDNSKPLNEIFSDIESSLKKDNSYADIKMINSILKDLIRKVSEADLSSAEREKYIIMLNNLQRKTSAAARNAAMLDAKPTIP